MINLNIEKSKKSEMIGKSKITESGSLQGSSRLVDSIISDNGLVMGNALIRESLVSNQGKVIGNPTIYKTYVGGNSTVSGDAVIFSSHLFNHSQVMDESTVVNSVLSEFAKIGDESFVKDSFIGGNVTITGKAMAIGIRLFKSEYLVEGLWEREPLHLTTKELSAIFRKPTGFFPLGITEGTGDKWTIGCTSYRYDFWVRHKELIRKLMGIGVVESELYSEALIRLMEMKRVLNLEEVKTDAEN